MISTNQITKQAILILTLERNCNVWRNNNLAVRGRKFIGKKGVPDIIGFHEKTGMAVYCEVKSITDSFSDEQHEFMRSAKKAGCHCLIATEENLKVIIKDYEISH